MSVSSRYRTPFLIVFLLALVTGTGAASAERSQQQLLAGSNGVVPSTTVVRIDGAQTRLAVLEARIDLDLEQMSLDRALRLVAEEAGLAFSYRSDLVEGHPPVALSLRGVTVEEALASVLRGTDLEAAVTTRGELILVERPGSRRSSALLQTGTIAGTVTDAQTGDELPGVNVVVVGTTFGAASGADGTYTITGIEQGTYSVRATFVGFSEQTIEGVRVEADETTTVDFEMQPAEIGLDEVVVIGYGEQQRRDLTGAITSISGDEVSDLPTSSIEHVLQGRAAGVNVRPNSGAPGSPISIQVRGIGTFGNTQPLFVIDGVPVFNDATGSQSPNPINLLNPNNIQSIEVLKDASATAIYGARAANGVVLITTKQGRVGDTQVSINASSGVQNFTDHIPMLNSQQYAEMANEADHAAGNPLQEALQDPAVLQQNTDWQEEAFSPAGVHDVSATISGGAANSRFAVMGGFFDESGVLPGHSYRRYNVRVNTDFSLLDNLSVGENLTLARAQWEGGKTGGDALVELLQSSPTLPVRCPENLGGYCGPELEITGRNARANRIAEMDLIQNDITQNRVLGNAYLDWGFLPGLSYRLNVGSDFTFGSSQNFTPRYEAGARSNPQASLGRSEVNNRSYLIENTLTYRKTFGRRHNVNAVGGFSQQESISESLGGSRQDFPSNDLRTIDAGLGQSNLSGGRSEWAIRSWLGRLNYNYDRRYLLTGTFRRDGSSRFGEENRWGNFPSFSLGWRLGEESFMQDVGFITELKLRGGWGKVGNQAGIGNYAAISTIDPVADYILGTGQNLAPGATFLSLGNPFLRWEESEQIDVGLDAVLLNGHVSLTFDYYDKDTEGVLLNLPINTTSGIRRSNGPVQNAGSIQNRGFEVSATYREVSGALQYEVSGNLSTVENEVLSLGGGEPIVNQVCADPACALTLTQVGGEIGAHYGYVMDGLFDNESEIEAHAEQPGAAPGDIRFRDLNGDGVINPDDRTVIGSAIPDFWYGFNARVSYRGLDLSAFFDGLSGRDVYNLQRPGIMEMQGDNNATTDALDRWTPDNRDTDIPRAVAGDPNNNDRSSTRFLEDGSFLRLNYVELGYRFDIPNLVTGASGLRVYVSSKNLLTLTGYSGWNPDIGSPTGDPTLAQGIDRGTFPQSRQFLAGIQLTL